MEVTKEYQKQIKTFLDAWGVTVDFSNRTDIGGGACGVNNNVIICKKYNTLDSMWSVVCHELCHILCYRSEIWYHYHRHINLKYIQRTAFRAEKYVDKKGSEIFKEFFPDLKYHWSYVGNRHKAWLRKYWSK